MWNFLKLLPKIALISNNFLTRKGPIFEHKYPCLERLRKQELELVSVYQVQQLRSPVQVLLHEKP